ncbi:endo alpha-1,4 polygalactosaminidase [Nocardioides bruguierae]|uniref:Endo alpha-1,4 polygalactosaminidase n=1 Tax=Nocardioides bruguierae TaxID=2945102 RepID=A0A9X2D4H4_9ACTN|nr:endo alpha-1,4 polygalactosaminidase [Nocardioides bruguierae]MCM0619153.1 endo alpha-1,4 polygalactosaminidase [Nocardioides bruguierae]
MGGRSVRAGWTPGWTAGIVTLLLLAGCSVPSGHEARSAGASDAVPSGAAATAGATAGDSPTRAPRLPADEDVDYQLGGAAEPDDSVGIVVRDRTEDPAGLYDVCYVNGFQTQPDQRRFWRQRWRLVLTDADGDPVVDEGWGEWLLDIRTPRRRARLARIMAGWTQGCADDGYEAVEYDNLDSFTRSRGLLSPRDARAYARLLARGAHAAGLRAAQKNRAGWDGTSVRLDLAVAEECGRYRECGSYRRHYGRQVLMVEYRRRDFRRTCRTQGAAVPVVLRDRALSVDGVRAYC